MFNKIVSLKTKVGEILTGATKFVKSKLPTVAGVSAATGALVLPTFASPEPVEVATAVTTDMIEPIIEVVTSNIAVIMPVGIALMGVLIGLRMIPRVLHMFMG